MASSVRNSFLKSVVAAVLASTGGVALAQSTVTLVAAPSAVTLPDGQSVPMWGYTCGDVLASPVPSANATCTALNGTAQTGLSWQPPLITVPVGQPLTITLIDRLTFATSLDGSTPPNVVPTSIVVDGQIGGGLGTDRTTMPSPAHAPQGTSWPGTRGGIDPATAAVVLDSGGAGYATPPAVTISGGGGTGAAGVAYIAGGVVTGVTLTSVGSGYTSAPTVTIAAPSPCTGTCTQATAHMNLTVLQSSDGSATFVPPPQPDRVRSMATEVTVADATGKPLTWTTLRKGTYLIHSGTQPSIQHPMGLYGVLVVTEPPVTGAGGTPVAQAYGTTFDKDVALLLSEIDPVQNRAVDVAVRTAGFSDTRVWSGKSGDCGDPGAPVGVVNTCYPPAVNYSPLYYLVNGNSFDRTADPVATGLNVPAAGAQGRVLLRVVNAGLRMHVPSVVGSSMTLLAEDGNQLPGVARVQSEVFLAAGKTYDVTIQPKQTTAGTYDPATYAVFDRALALSTSNQRDGGMQIYVNVAGGAAAPVVALSASDRTYNCFTGSTLTISDQALGVLAGAKGASGAVLGTTTLPAGASLDFHSDGTFTYVPPAAPASCSGSFTYLVNGKQSHTATIADCAGSATCAGQAPQALNGGFTSPIATRIQVPPPGVLQFVKNVGGYALTAVAGAGTNTCGSVSLYPDGSFIATPTSPPTTAPATCSFTYNVKTSSQMTSAGDGTISVTFEGGSGLAVKVVDAVTGVEVKDYRWIIEEDRTFWVDPKCQVNSTDPNVRPSYCPPLPVESMGYSFHTSNMGVVAQGCVGAVSCEAGQTVQGSPATCDIGNGVCRAQADAASLGVTVDPSAGQQIPVLPSAVHLDPTKRYFLSILPGDGINPTIGGAGGPDATGKPFSIATACGPYTGPTGAWEPGGAAAMCGHAMGGAQLPPVPPGAPAGYIRSANVILEQTPLPTARIAAFVFQDDNPLNGENDAGGGVDVLAPNEAGLGGFELKLFDQAGQLGDATGQITYDMFNQPVSNALAGHIDPITGLDACPISARKDGIIGNIPTCPTYESDGKTPSPLAGQAIIANLYPGFYEVQAYPAADRIAAGEEWLQTNTLDGTKPHEAFIRPNEPGYFQEFGPGNFHVSIGFANPRIINDRKAAYCSSALNNLGPCNNTLTVHVTNTHMSRTPDERTFSSETYDHYAFTQCYVSIGPADGADFAFQKCDANGNAVFTNMPAGTFKIAVFDQWNDIMLDGLVGTIQVAAGGGAQTQEFPAFQWRANLYTRTFIDQNGDGVSQDAEPGLALVNTNIRYRDGSIGFFNNTDLNGFAGWNEVFPLMNWLVVETSATRFKPTSTHAVYDAGGAVDCSSQAPGGLCTNVAAHLASTAVRVPLPTDLRVPGAKYCDNADCPASDAGGGASTGMIFPPQPFGSTMGWQGLLGQNSFIEFGVKPYATGENGGINGHVIYASTRPFDDPSLLLQLSWEPGVPNVKVNLYAKTVDANGNEVLHLVDTTTTTSWDDWAQGFRKNPDGTYMRAADGVSYVPNMNCPGQDGASPFFLTLKDSKQWLDASNPKLPLAYHSQFKCFDGWAMLNQIQPAPYDGKYAFPSVTGVNAGGTRPGSFAGSSCHMATPAEPWGCTTNPSSSNPTDPTYDAVRAGAPMLLPGKYVVEVVPPTGYELVKEEDKNILLGDVYIAPVTQQFAGFGNIFIMPDQASVNSQYNRSNPGGLDNTRNQGVSPRGEGDTGSIEAYWPCVGAERIVPDLNSLFPGAGQAAPFAGARRRLCDRKEVVLSDQSSALVKFYVFSSTHIAGHFTGTITNDFASEFDPFSPQFGEKFGPPNLPVAFRDYNGNEVARVYGDQWGMYDGLYYSTWGVNPPNPTGYVPQMPIACMNDPGPILDTNPASITYGKMITDPSYNSAYSNFCYEWSMMPGTTAYMDTPVIPTQAFADNYNLPDAEYPNGTPAIQSVTSTAAPGPWVHAAVTAANATATITFTNVSVNDQVTSVVEGATTLTSGPIVCNGAVACTSTMTQAARNNLMAQLVAANIAARATTTGVTATQSTNTVTLRAVATGTALNGVNVTVNQIGITVGGTLAFAGGADAAAASLGLTITALGDKVVQNPNFSGPSSTTAPFNQKTITRHYGFGSRPSNCPAAGNCPAVTVGGVSLQNVGTWTDTTIVGTVNPTNVPACAVQQQKQGATRCGELVITAANGKQSIDAITVTIGGSAPWVVTANDVASNTGGTVVPPAGKSVKDYTAAFGRMWFSPLQTAIDSADPGDLILVQPGVYRENLLVWKPVRIQGVGAPSVTINADAHPAGKLDAWRRQVNCAFGLNLDGVPNPGNANFQGLDPNDAQYSCPNEMHQRVDRIPFESIVGWDTSGNGNLAQLLQEPTLMGSYEGAGITVLGRGVRIPATSNDFWGQGTAEADFPGGSTWLTNSALDCTARPGATDGRDYGTSNYYCKPARIDGLSVTNSSQGGGGIFIHGWGHFLDVANTRITGNAGTLAGAINVGNGETPDAYINDGVNCGGPTPALACPPVPPLTPVNAAIPAAFNTNVHVHHNMLYDNASVGDALFSGTPAGAGGVTVSMGSDRYVIDHNWIAGNLSTGDGGGLQHLGLSFNGTISHNFVLFNQSTNPTLPTNGGGIVVEGANLDRQLNGTECGSTSDQDCPPGLGEGTGPGLVIDGNLILGNSAESGSGGGIRIQQVNGSELVAFPVSVGAGLLAALPGWSQWYDVTVTNNIIANNVAGYDGGGVSIEDSLRVTVVNNTISSNDTTASAGVLFKTLGAIMGASPPPGCTPTTDPTLPQNPNCTVDNAQHGPQPAGLVTMTHTPNLLAALPANVLCPNGYNYAGGTVQLAPPGRMNGDCRTVSKPAMANDLFWQNRAFHVDIVGMGTGYQSQQNIIAITPTLNQTATGQCVSSTSPGFYWDLGYRTDDVLSGRVPAGSTLTLSNSILSSLSSPNLISGNYNLAPSSSPVFAQTCNGARVPPENCASQAGQVNQASCQGYNTPVGASETTGLNQVFLFNGIKPTATVDEGHNWLNLVYGPLTLNRPSTVTNPAAPEAMLASAAIGTTGGSYSPAAGSPAINAGANSCTDGGPAVGCQLRGGLPLPSQVGHDFFGNTRQLTNGNPADIGAVERQ